jgi:hypothetical protein
MCVEWIATDSFLKSNRSPNPHFNPNFNQFHTHSAFRFLHIPAFRLVYKFNQLREQIGIAG